MRMISRWMAFGTLLFTAACTKSGHLSDLEGHWKLTRSIGGGVTGNGGYVPGNGATLDFHATAFTWTIPPSTAKTGTFSLEPAVFNAMVLPDRRVHALNLYSTDTLRDLIYLSGDTLILNYGSSAYDGLEDIFIRN